MTPWDTSDSHKSWGSNLVFWSSNLTFCVWTGYPPSKIPPTVLAEKTPFLLGGPTTLTFPLFFVRLRFLRHVVIDPPSISTRHFPQLRPEINSEKSTWKVCQATAGQIPLCFHRPCPLWSNCKDQWLPKTWADFGRCSGDPSGWSRKLYQLGFLVK